MGRNHGQNSPNEDIGGTEIKICGHNLGQLISHSVKLTLNPDLSVIFTIIAEIQSPKKLWPPQISKSRAHVQKLTSLLNYDPLRSVKWILEFDIFLIFSWFYCWFEAK